MYKALQQIQQKFDLCDDVWHTIERKVYESLYRDSMAWVTDAKIHRDIARCSRNGGDTRSSVHYGRHMLHWLRPVSYRQYFSPIHPDCDQILQVGGAEFISYRYTHDPWRRHTRTELNFGSYTTKDALIKAIETNTNGRKIKGIKSMSKPKLFQTLMKRPEFILE